MIFARPIWLIAYTAGLLDGEGSIQINAAKNKKYGTAYWVMSVHIANNEVAVLDELCAEWGLGSVNSFASRGSRTDRRNGRWSLYGREAEELLREVLPYLWMKRAQALLALEFRNHVGFAKGTRELPVGATVKRNEIAERMRVLNAKNLKGPDARKRLAVVR